MTSAGPKHDLCRGRQRRPAWCRYTVYLLGLCLFWGNLKAAGQNPRPTEYEVKAAYLYQFGKFVKWPKNALEGEPSFPICVIGSDPFGPALDSIVSGESLEGKPLSARRVSNISQASRCRILFVGIYDQQRLSTVIEGLRGTPVLTVSDAPDFIQHGGIVQFVTQGDRVRFLVNLSASERAGLALSSELLKVAVSVQRDAQAGD